MHTSGCQKEMVEGLHIEYYIYVETCESYLQGERVCNFVVVKYIFCTVLILISNIKRNY